MSDRFNSFFQSNVSNRCDSGKIGLKPRAAKAAILSEPARRSKSNREIGKPLKLQPDNSATHKIFTAHGAGYVMVSGERFEHAIVVTPEQVLTDWRPQDFAALNEVHFKYFLRLQPEILLLGTGSQQHFPHPSLYRQLIAARISLECMDTPAACRTYNILVSEDRKVVAAILF